MNPSVRFITLGCRVNQYETEAMRGLVANAGMEAWEGSRHLKSREAVSFVVINTCTVTDGADRENFYWIRRAKREHPEAKIVVTGCFVERNRREIEVLPEVDLVIANHEKSEIVSLLNQGCGTNAVQDRWSTRAARQTYSNLSVSQSQDRSRAYIKIQDGCNHACSFCKVVLVRGRSRSRLLKDIREEAEKLRDSGHREVVLAGIQLGAYGFDLTPSVGLTHAIEACSIDGIERIRLSSIEPTDVKPELIAMMKNNPKCCHHLHIPLQSGDDEVLKWMNRRYSGSFYRDLVAALKAAMPDFSLTLDVMAGFPGEEERHFENTIKLLEETKPLKCHVFPYSKREGTQAFRLKDISLPEIRERVNRLIAVGERTAREVSLPYVGKTVSVLTSKGNKKRRGKLIHGVTPNFLKVCFQGEESHFGRIVSVTLLTLQGSLFLGRLEPALLSDEDRLFQSRLSTLQKEGVLQ